MRPETRVVGVDPGGTTGVAVVVWDDLQRCYRLGLVLATPMPAGIIEQDIDDLMPDAVAVERFVVGRRAARSKSAGAGAKARDIIGALTAHFPQLYQHSAHDAKKWATDERLKAAGLYRPDSGPHIRDATRHALFALRRHYRTPDPLSATYRHREV